MDEKENADRKIGVFGAKRIRTPHPPQCAAEQCSALPGTFPSRGRQRR